MELTCISNNHLSGCKVLSLRQIVYQTNDNVNGKCFNYERICIYTDLHQHRCTIRNKFISIQDMGDCGTAYFNALLDTVCDDAVILRKRTRNLFL